MTIRGRDWVLPAIHWDTGGGSRRNADAQEKRSDGNRVLGCMRRGIQPLDAPPLTPTFYGFFSSGFFSSGFFSASGFLSLGTSGLGLGRAGKRLRISSNSFVNSSRDIFSGGLKPLMSIRGFRRSGISSGVMNPSPLRSSRSKNWSAWLGGDLRDAFPRSGPHR